MRIIIDGRLYCESGVGRYIRNLIFHLGKIDKSNEYILLLLKKNLGVSLPKNFTKVEADIPWYGLAEQVRMPKLIEQQKPDLVHFPHFNVPIMYKGKFVVTIHDLIHYNFSMQRASTHGLFVHAIKKAGYKKVLSSALKRSSKVITVSNFVKKQLDGWPVEKEKVVVTTEGVEENLLEITGKIKDSEIKKVLDKFGVRQPFIFYVGNAHPHKNVEGLIKAFLKIQGKFQYLQLVLAGNDHYFWKRIREKKHAGNIIFTGYVTDAELVALYKTAQCFVMPSFSEGFGIPLLEAFACRCPVASSREASLPEVGGEAAIYFDPYNIEEMAEKISTVLNDQALRKGLIKKGIARYKQFSWRKMVVETLKVYQNA